MDTTKFTVTDINQKYPKIRHMIIFTFNFFCRAGQGAKIVVPIPVHVNRFVLDNQTHNFIFFYESNIRTLPVIDAFKDNFKIFSKLTAKSK